MVPLRVAKVQQLNARGEWVPSIPLPLYLVFGRCLCSCKRKFRTERLYRAHYALDHILYPEAGA